MQATKKRVGVLRGGAGKHYETSLKKGGEVISYITDNLGNKYEVSDILVDKDHVWHFRGTPINPGDLVNKVDLVWNVSHPSYSNVLDSLSVPNVGVSAFTFTLENNKDLMRDHLKKIGLSLPRSVVLPLYQEDFDGPRAEYAAKAARKVFEKFSSPWIIESFTPDSNMGIHVAKTFPALVAAIEDGVNHGKSIIVKEFIAGKVASVHSVPKFRGEGVYTFPLPGVNLLPHEKEKIFSSVRGLHEHLNASHYLKSDFILNPYGRVYLLGVESTPDLRENSHFSEACGSVGTNMHHVVDHILQSV